MGLGVYIHFPFCRSRCPHCDFVTTDSQELHRRYRSEYPQTLRREWALRRELHRQLRGSSLASIFIGGGTPNLMTTDEIAPLLTDILCGVAGVDAGLEITMEMNPGISDAEEMRQLREAGINRASIGVQSTDDQLLRSLGRIHTVAEARQAFDDARAVEFDSAAVDLIFAIPGQTLDQWETTLTEVIRWDPDHISTYNLTAKDNTPLGERVRAGEISLPSDDVCVAMFELAHRLLSDAGFEHYEISNHAKPGKRCRHNSDIWRGEPYLGIGLGAHSCFDDERFWNTDNWEEYHTEVAAGRLPVHSDIGRDEAARFAERISLGLRTCDGIDINLFGERHRDRITALVEEGLAEIENDCLRLTLHGWAVADAVVLVLLR